MTAAYSKLIYHMVFSTKNRRQRIHSRLRDRLYAYISGVIRKNHGMAIEIGGMPDHVHILLALNPSLAVADATRLIKSNSSKWINESGEQGERFEWQRGYAAFSVSESQLPRVQRYVQNQAEHHQTRSFTEEIKELLHRHSIQFEESDVASFGD